MDYLNKISKGEDIQLTKKNTMLEDVFHYNYTIDCINGEINYIYTKRKYPRVKVMCNWTANLLEFWNKLVKNSSQLEFTTENTDIDYYVIINKPIQTDFFIPSKTIVFRMEPDTNSNELFYNKKWDDWYASKKSFLFFGDLETHMNNTEWHLSKTYTDLLISACDGSIVKTKTLSTIVSNLYFMKGHKLRLDFLRYIDSKINIDVYGFKNTLFRNYKSSLPYHCKDSGIFPYKYTFACENCSMNNYFTEKITDAIMGECLCFYWGCPNLDTFINPEAYIRLDLENFEKSLKIMIDCISNHEWEKRIHIIREEKIKILRNYSFGKRVWSIINKSNAV